MCLLWALPFSGCFVSLGADVQLWLGELLVGCCVGVVLGWVQAMLIANVLVQTVYYRCIVQASISFTFRCTIRTVPQSTNGHTRGKRNAENKICESSVYSLLQANSAVALLLSCCREQILVGPKSASFYPD